MAEKILNRPNICAVLEQPGCGIVAKGMRLNVVMVPETGHCFGAAEQHLHAAIVDTTMRIQSKEPVVVTARGPDRKPVRKGAQALGMGEDAAGFAALTLPNQKRFLCQVYIGHTQVEALLPPERSVAENRQYGAVSSGAQDILLALGGRNQRANFLIGDQVAPRRIEFREPDRARRVFCQN